jgi:hypothetical protein
VILLCRASVYPSHNEKTKEFLMPAHSPPIDGAGSPFGARPIGAPLSVDDLAAMGPSEAAALVCKDAVWPPPDWKAMVAEGAAPLAAALVKLIRDRIPSKPDANVQQRGTTYTKRKLRDPQMVRRDYVTMLGEVRDALMACRTADDVRAARARALRAVGWTERAGAEMQHLVTSVWNGRVDTLQVDYRDAARAENMVREGWPGAAVPTWRRGHNALQDSDGSWMLTKGMTIVSDGFPSEDEAWEWLRQRAQARRADSGAAPAPSRPTVEEPSRSGLADHRGGTDATVTGMLDAFGLRAVEFGKWVPHHERLDLLNRTWDALADLAGLLGVQPAAIGLGGTLSLSFGARASGTAGADYDHSLRAIALPRSFGAGELAHCWGHALDHWAGEFGLRPRAGSPRLASGWAQGGARPDPEVDHLPPSLGGAWKRVIDAIWCRTPSLRAEAAALEGDLARREGEVAEAGRQLDAYKNRAGAAAETPEARAYLSKMDAWISARRDKAIPELRARLAALSARLSSDGETAFAAEARRLCGKEGSFWARPHEMFARAFECWAWDALAGSGARNDFLVHGVEPGRFASGWRGNPYPEGGERERIRAAVADLVAAAAPILEEEAKAAPRPDARRGGPIDERDHLFPEADAAATP